ncbi:SLATT domain-containing protein [Catellatospora citrea]|uniref:SMODS and SLOG-associating 2TM effector domain-containing protein n=1 Tax=Catellatospora citrea TaxID=53366 RepID=A0A8J3P438_9ACTN|nr:SLATT domain-containing protein [Catellatospora citrea]GIG03286.1 hypothetical protein Cci01nite_83790 [Catellatospora citrea]
MADVVNTADEQVWRDNAEEEIRQLVDDMLYTEKTHLSAAERLQYVHRALGLSATISASASAATIVGDLVAWVPGTLALIAAISSAVLTFVKPEQLSEQHLSAGRQLNALRVQARQLLSLDLPRLPFKDVRRAIADIATKKATVDTAAPATNGKNFKIASQRIKSGVYVRD